MGQSGAPTLTRTEITRSRRQGQGTLGSGVVVALVAWFLSRLIVGLSWGPARNPFDASPTVWMREDSFNYYVISLHGRTFGRCGSPGFAPNALERVAHLKWCGTAVWLPGYPWLIHALNVAGGISTGDAGVVISWVAMAVAIYLVWVGWCRDLHPWRAVLVLVAFGTFPGAVYNFAYFPTSLALACVVGAVLAAVRERFLFGAILMTLGGLFYPSTWFAAVGLAVGLVLLSLRLGLVTTVRRALWGLAGLASLVILGIHDQVAFGYADAYLKYEEQSTTSPWHELFGLFQQDSVEQVALKPFYRILLAVQGAIAIVVSLGSAVVALVPVGRRRWDPALVYPALTSIGVVVGVIVGGGVAAWNRNVVLGALCVVSFRRLPLPLLVAFVAAIAVITSLISYSFFNGTMI